MPGKCRFLSIASSSSGNAHVVDSDGRLLLVDCGISPRKLTSGLQMLGRRLEDVDYVLITHTHTDHVAGLWGLLKRTTPVVFGPPSLEEDVARYGGEFVPLKKGAYSLNGFSINAFELSHDSLPTFGFRIEIADRVFGIATDLGLWDDDVLDAIEGCDALLWEANHDEQLLACGSYPANLKKRISGTRGHLSNNQSVSGIGSLNSLPGKLLLGHLSRKNNTVDHVGDAYASAHLDKHMDITVIDPHSSGPVIEL